MSWLEIDNNWTPRYTFRRITVNMPINRIHWKYVFIFHREYCKSGK